MGGVAWPKVGIVGGSLGGLIAALHLQDVGCDVHVFERAPVPLEGRGAGIVLHPVTVRIFEDHGLLDLGRVSSSASVLRYVDGDGRTVLEEPIAYRFTSYATLYSALVGFLDPDRYHLGKELMAFDDDEPAPVKLRFADGSEEEVDLLVGADGIRSTTRGLLFPHAHPVYSGYVGWRGTQPDDELPPSSRSLRNLLTYHVGDHTHVLSYEIPDLEVRGRGRSMNWVWYRNVAEGPELTVLLTDRHGARHDLSMSPGDVAPTFVEELRRTAEVLPPAFRDLIRSTPEPFLQVIVDVEVPAMVLGRVCVMGDAAFGLRPHVAAGTAKASADARALADALRHAEGDVAAALARWEAPQLTLARAALARTREVGERAQLRGTFTPGDPSVAFGLYRPKDHNFPSG